MPIVDTVMYYMLLIWCQYPIFGEATGSDNEIARLVSGNTKFAFKLLNQLRRVYPEKNLFFSPASLSTTLAMLYLGSNGATKTQMDNVLGYGLFEEKVDIHKVFKSVLEDIESHANNYTLDIANGFFAADKFEYLPTFVNSMEYYYNATVENLDFASQSDSCLQYLNYWLGNKTDGNIIGLFQKGSITPLTTAIVINTIYFNGVWTTPFNIKDTVLKPFHLAPNVNKDMYFMNKEDNYEYVDVLNLRAKIVRLHYLGDAVSMYVILPDNLMGLRDLERTLSSNPNILTNALLGLQGMRVQLSLPRFKMDVLYNLNQQLSSLGLSHLFSPVASDLSLATASAELFVSQVLHGAFLEINEQGTEAASASYVQVAMAAYRPKFLVDHPFLFLIRHDKSESILFLGSIKSPPEGSDTLGDLGLGLDVTDKAYSVASSWIHFLFVMLNLLTCTLNCSY